MESSVYLVACSSSKRAFGRAADLYTSPLFTRSLAYARALARDDNRIGILSALHGLLPLRKPVLAYDLALQEQPVAARRAWGHRVVVALRERFGDGPRALVLLAGASYVEPIAAAVAASALPWAIREPLAGMTILRRLAWLNERVRRATLLNSAIGRVSAPTCARSACSSRGTVAL